MSRGRRSAFTILCAVVLAALGCSRRPRELVIFHATSLTQPLGEIVDIYKRDNPGVSVRLEPSGSQVAARKISEQNMRADIVAVADAKVIERILVPTHARFNLIFATNEIVLGHKDHSRYTDEITSQSWPEVLRRSGVRIGRADPDTAPIGYHTLLVWQLAERSEAYGAAAKGLAAELMGHCDKAGVVHDETELLAQLESRAVDYAFLFRTTAEDHHLKMTVLPPEQSLSRLELADQYASASVHVRMKQGESKTHVVGAPVTYGLTIPVGAPHDAEARRFVAFLLGDKGTQVLGRRGFGLVRPARCAPCGDVPPELGDLVPLAR